MAYEWHKYTKEERLDTTYSIEPASTGICEGFIEVNNIEPASTGICEKGQTGVLIEMNNQEENINMIR